MKKQFFVFASLIAAGILSVSCTKKEVVEVQKAEAPKVDGSPMNLQGTWRGDAVAKVALGESEVAGWDCDSVRLTVTQNEGGINYKAILYCDESAPFSYYPRKVFNAEMVKIGKEGQLTWSGINVGTLSHDRIDISGEHEGNSVSGTITKRGDTALDVDLRIVNRFGTAEVTGFLKNEKMAF